MNHASLERVRHGRRLRAGVVRVAPSRTFQDASDVALGISLGTLIDGGHHGEEG
jgi:hypothetical protein